MQTQGSAAKQTLGTFAIYSWSRFEGSHPRVRSSGRWCRHRETDDTRGHKGTPTHNTTDKPLHSTLNGPWPAAAGAACSCNAKWCGTARLYFSSTACLAAFLLIFNGYTVTWLPSWLLVWPPGCLPACLPPWPPKIPTCLACAAVRGRQVSCLSDLYLHNRQPTDRHTAKKTNAGSRVPVIDDAFMALLE